MESSANSPTGHPAPPHGPEPPPTEAEAQRLRGELARTTDKYRALVHTMDQGFCLLKVLFDEAGQQGRGPPPPHPGRRARWV